MQALHMKPQKCIIFSQLKSGPRRKSFGLVFSLCSCTTMTTIEMMVYGPSNLIRTRNELISFNGPHLRMRRTIKMIFESVQPQPLDSRTRSANHQISSCIHTRISVWFLLHLVFISPSIDTLKNRHIDLCVETIDMPK